MPNNGVTLGRTRLARLLGLILVFGCLLVLVLDSVFAPVVVEDIFPARVPEPPRRFDPSVRDEQYISVELYPMKEFDFWSKEKLYAFRRARVRAEPRLAQVFIESVADYEPSSHVFAQLTSQATWWGILGLNYYGSGPKSIEGPSEESRFIGNPYLLVGLGERYLLTPRTVPAEKAPYHARAVSVTWDLARRHVRCDFDVTSYFQTVDSLQLDSHWARHFSLICYNARDLGFLYARIPADRLKGVEAIKPSKPFVLRQYLHRGGSSGYPGGSNNMSPQMDELDIRVVSLPASCEVELWLSEPQEGQPADMTCSLHLD